MTFHPIDYLVCGVYILAVLGLGLFVSKDKKGHKKDSKDYFLAGNALPWWVVGATVIASNISAEQFIGMSGSGYAIGLAIASYEWVAAIALILVAKYFIPVFLEKKIFTMPQFLEMRFDKRVSTSLAVFWLLVYVFVNMTSVLYLGALAMQTIVGIPLLTGIVFLAIFSALITIYGGLTAVAWTDVMQVVVLVGGGLITTFFALDAVSGHQGVWVGLTHLLAQVPDKFDMILSPSNPHYKEMPGLGVLLWGMWIANLYYWGCNQYITQRALAAKSVKEAQRGLIFAGYLKILMPLIVVLPGICAFALNPGLAKPDEAYPWLLQTFVPTGLKGLAFAALIAAIVAALSSMVNSTATIFTMDIYKPFFEPDATESRLVRVGRLASIGSTLIAVLIAPGLKTLDQAFQFIQEFTGFVSPGILLIFLFGLFWRRTTTRAVLWAAGLTLPLSLLFKYTLTTMPFMDRIGLVFAVLAIQVVVMSLCETKLPHPRAIAFKKGIFHTDGAFNAASVGICGILTALYLAFW